MPKRILQGKVVSNKADKSVVVLVERRFKHPLLGKVVRKSKKFMAHDEHNTASVGDVVTLQECRPLSKNKTWVLVDNMDSKSGEAS